MFTIASRIPQHVRERRHNAVVMLSKIAFALIGHCRQCCDGLLLHVALVLAISAHSQPEQERERRDQGIEIGNKGIALESRGHLLLRLRRAHGPEVPGRRA